MKIAKTAKLLEMIVSLSYQLGIGEAKAGLYREQSVAFRFSPLDDGLIAQVENDNEKLAVKLEDKKEELLRLVILKKRGYE